MALNSVIGALRVDLGLNSAAFQKGLSASEKELRQFQRNVNRIGQNLQSLGTKLSIGLTLPIVGLVAKSLDAAKKQEAAVAQVEAALRSMGNQAGFTSQQLQDMASQLQRNSLFGDEEILDKVTANLLTFGNVAGEAFSRAQVLALDLSARLDQDLKSSAIQLGKALNDPVEGLTALSRVGVQFTEQQERQIRAMAEAGRVAEAQSLILDELERQYAGQAAAVAQLDSGKITQAWNRIGDALERVGAIVLPVVADILTKLGDLADAFSELSPRVQKFGVIALGVFAAGGPLLIGIGLAVSAFAALIPVIAAIAVPLAIIAGVVGVAAAGFALFGKAARDAEQPIYNAAAATAAINGELDAFYLTAAPSAGKAAIDLANDYVRLAEEAYNAAEAQLANTRATLESYRASQRIIDDAPSFGMGGLSSARSAAEAGERDALRDVEAALDAVEQAEKDLAEARRNQKRAAEAVTGSTYDYSEATREAAGETKLVVDGLEDLGRVGGSGGSGRTALEGIRDAAEEAADAMSALDRALGSVIDGFARGDLAGGIRDAFDGLKREAVSGFSSILTDAFKIGGGGFGTVFSRIGDAIRNTGSALSSVFSGGGLGAIGTAVSSFLPVLGAIGAVGGLLKGLIGSKTVIGQGFDIGVDGGDLTGGQFTTTRTKRLFGLISSTRSRVNPFSDEVAEALTQQIEGIQGAVGAVFEDLGVEVSQSAIDGINFAVQRFDTRGLDQAQIEAKFTEIFGQYADTLSLALGNITFEAAALLADVSRILRPAGQSFFGSLEFMADAAEDLAARFGGAGNLASSVEGFVQTFFTEAEKLQILNDNVADTFADLGLAIPKTISAFKELVLSQNLMTEAGREAYAALLDIAPQFKAITDAVSDFGLFDFSEKRFNTLFEEQVAQIAAARSYGENEVRALTGGTLADPTNPNNTLGILTDIRSLLDDIFNTGIPERA